MRGTALCLLALVLLCSGQTCSLPATLPGGPTGLIPAGVYSGDVTYGGNATTNGTVIAEFEPLPSAYSCQFGSEGLPLVDANTSIDVGSKVITSFNDNATTMTVTAIHSITGGVSIDYDVVMDYEVNGVTVDATGSANETFVQTVGGKLDYAFEMSIDFLMDTTPIHMAVTGDGQLSK
jgi:hypothetical protein